MILFYVCLGDKIRKLIKSSIFRDEYAIESDITSRSLDNAQKQVEERAYEQRRNLFKYDQVLDQQRRIVYYERRSLLVNASPQGDTLANGEYIICGLLKLVKKRKINGTQAVQLFENLLGRNLDNKLFDEKKFNQKKFDTCEVHSYFFQEFWLAYQIKMDEFNVHGDGCKLLRDFEAQIKIINIDLAWQDHLEKMSLLRDAVGWRGYGQRNPLSEYKRDAYTQFKGNKENFIHYSLYQFFRITIL